MNNNKIYIYEINLNSISISNELKNKDHRNNGSRMLFGKEKKKQSNE